MAAYTFPFFKVAVDPATHIAEVQLSRPKVLNAMDGTFWSDFPKLIDQLEADAEVRVVIVYGDGPHFTSGLDLGAFYLQTRDLIHSESGDVRELLYKHIRHMQSGFDKIYGGEKIYICAIHGYCIGAGLDLAAACDIRLASQDAVISLREAKVGIVADLGSLQRLPYIIGIGQTRLLAYSGRDITATEAARIGLVEALAADKAALLEAANALAQEIGSNPNIAVRGTKKALNAGIRMGVEEGLEQVALQNAAYLDSKDFREVIQATIEKRAPRFS